MDNTHSNALDQVGRQQAGGRGVLAHYKEDEALLLADDQRRTVQQRGHRDAATLWDGVQVDGLGGGVVGQEGGDQLGVGQELLQRDVVHLQRRQGSRAAFGERG